MCERKAVLFTDILTSGMRFHTMPCHKKTDNAFLSCLLILQDLHYFRTRAYVAFDSFVYTKNHIKGRILTLFGYFGGVTGLLSWEALDESLNLRSLGDVNVSLALFWGI